MAKTLLNSIQNPDGSFTITYTDNTTAKMTAAQAQAAKALPSDLSPTTSSKPDIAGGYGGGGNPSFTSTAQNVTDTATGITTPTTGTLPFKNPKTGVMEVTDIGKQIAAARIPAQYAYIRKNLVETGLLAKGSKSQTITQNAWLQVLIGAQTAKMDPFEYMKEMRANGVGLNDTSNGPSTNISIRTYTPETIRTIADQLYINKLGKRVSDTDLQKLSDQLNALEKKTPTKSVSVPNAAGTSTTTTTSGGVDEQAFISKQAEQMPEYGRMQNINFASWLDKAMTTGQPSIGSLTNG